MHILDTLRRRDRRNLNQFMTELHVSSGTKVTNLGEVGREFLILMDGSADIEVDGTVIGQCTSGDFLGELAMLGHVWGSDPYRRATVLLTSDSRVGAFNLEDFTQALDAVRPIRKAVLTQAEQLGLVHP